MVKTQLVKYVIIPFWITFLLIFCQSESRAKTIPDVFITAKAAFLMDANTRAILYEKNPDLKLSPASTTKVMTAIVAIENKSPDAFLRVNKCATRVQPCKIPVRVGEKWIVEDLLRCILLNSANDASVVIAEGTAGSVGNFARLMNLKAKEIGADNTHFTNPHGLDQKGHYSTARDLTLIFQYAMKNPFFREIVQTQSISIQGPSHRLIYLRNHNRLLGKFEGIIGGKTGYTRKAKKCFVGEATRNGRDLLVCVLGSQNHFQDAAWLLNYGFNGGDLKEDSAIYTVQNQENLNNQSRGYVLQVASFSDLDNALILNKNLSDNGYPSFIENSSFNNGTTRHRVKVGFYPDLESARRTKECILKYFGLDPLILHQGKNTCP